jgi:hypothetical protein
MRVALLCVAVSFVAIVLANPVHHKAHKTQSKNVRIQNDLDRAIADLQALKYDMVDAGLAQETVNQAVQHIAHAAGKIAKHEKHQKVTDAQMDQPEVAEADKAKNENEPSAGWFNWNSATNSEAKNADDANAENADAANAENADADNADPNTNPSTDPSTDPSTSNTDAIDEDQANAEAKKDDNASSWF